MVGLLAAVVAAASPAWSAGTTPPVRTAPPKNRKPVITNPDWAALPSPDDIARYYPEHAMRNSISGRAVIGCFVSAEGLLTNCKVISESPPGEDFGAAAVRMAPAFRMKPKTLDGTPVEGAEVRIPIVFQAPEQGAPIMMGQASGPPPPLPPMAGQFLYMGAGSADVSDSSAGPVFLYLRTPDSPPVDGVSRTWMVIVFPPTDGRAMYWMLDQTLDCAGRRISPQSVQVFMGPGERVGWSGPVNAGWQATDDPVMGKGLDLACGVAKPGAAALPDVAAVRKDAAARFAAAGSK
ncbi:TonB family protein [Caulobacter ginsengisoli]|uniref:TonB family protein n=1 Tax=Caulobacter ginsengisoli TaxID=400775 RepID=A0ABU0IT31_9CAUL|nr:energy transducer TonB [Caulobacter ginsengisoli]MDQ0464580.1 TonB family protein [Caulobacter ginsengisoli]